MAERYPVAAYYYPQDNLDPQRVNRAKKMGLTRVPTEMELLRQATPLFDGHEHPTYTIGDGITRWNDDNPSAIARQLELAREGAIDVFIVDTYAGRINGLPSTELGRPLDLISQQAAGKNLKYCLMTCIEKPRARLPVKQGQDHYEPNRSFDLSMGTFMEMIDTAAAHWDNAAYFQMNGAPYLSIYGLRPDTIAQLKMQEPDLIPRLLHYCEQRYGVRPYLVGVANAPLAARLINEMGFDAITTYANLAEFDDRVYFQDFGPGSDRLAEYARPDQIQPLQTYEGQAYKRMQEWLLLKSLGVDNFVPSATVGWDTSARAEGGALLADVAGQYPFTPIITDPSPEKFLRVLHAIRDYFPKHVQERNRLYVVCAANEIAEAASLWPRLNEDGSVDFSYLNALRGFVQSLDSGN